MNQLLSLILLSVTISVSADVDSAKYSNEQGPVTSLTDGQAIVMALLANPEIGKRLRKEHLTHVGRMTRQQLQPGVTRFVIQVGTCGNCQPKSGTVTVTEDMRPTYMDGATAYAVSIQIPD